MNHPIKGSCLCRRVKYSTNGTLKNAMNCHCSIHFRTRAQAYANDLKWDKGENVISYDNSSKGHYRAFCNVCDSTLITKFDDSPEVVAITLGTLDDDPGFRPEMYVHAADKTPWHEITDDLKQYTTIPTKKIAPHFQPEKNLRGKHPILNQRLTPMQRFFNIKNGLARRSLSKAPE